MKGIRYMKAYEIIESENDTNIGVLLYYEKEKTFVIELADFLDEWTAPVLFSGFVKKKIYTIPRDISIAWVRERVIPSGRQNINDILAHHKLKEYDEMAFLEISSGRCSQDDLYIRKTDELPDYAVRRRKKNLIDIVTLEHKELLCFFADETVKKIELEKLGKSLNNNTNGMITGADIEKIINNDKLFESGRVGTGGYFATFNDSIDISAAILYQFGHKLPLSLQDFLTFVQKNIIDTTESCNELGCSRQNIAYMVSKGGLRVVKPDMSGNVYLKGDVIQNKW